MLTYACLVRGCSLSEGSREMEREEESQLGRRWWRAGKVDTRPRGRLIIADPEDRPTPWGPPLFVLFPSYTNARSTTDI